MKYKIQKEEIEYKTFVLSFFIENCMKEIAFKQLTSYSYYVKPHKNGVQIKNICYRGNPVSKVQLEGILWLISKIAKK